ncbi:MAG: dockerin type I domain-containing protein [Oscillospiraceae bacterium]|nr:dockerin type I domain-containing protein [Oscillospiraceae bacterium]
MKINLKRIAAGAAAAVVGFSSMAVPQQKNKICAANGTGKSVVENLNRGVSAIKTGSGMLVSWRFLADDDDNAEFRLYRNGSLIYTSKAGEATCYLDKDGNSSAQYKVETVVNNKVVSSEGPVVKSDKSYFDIKLDVPSGSGCSYSPNDCSIGDADGDGTYEIFVKWDPSNQKDNSQEGNTGNVYIDCYTLTGKKLWRVDLGKNIRAGAHYTQFLVADFDGDGKAEMTCKTADGTVDGTGKTIGDKNKDWDNGKGYILDGPEFYTLFDGATGAALDTVDYAFPRGKVSDWGDNYGNRVDRFLGAVCYLDGVHPSAVSVRGYYTRMTIVAYDVVNKKLVKRWTHDSGKDASQGYGNGNHNCMPADVDNDGKQELCLGATCIDDNGKTLWCTKLGHGDAMHLGDFVPDRKGLEEYVCHESAGGVSLIDAATGQSIFRINASGDTGRACCDNVYSGNKGAEFWGAYGNNVVDSNGKSTGVSKPAQNFLCFWDGDLEREILDGTKISKVNNDKSIKTLLNADGCASNNGTKSVPCLEADILGDWREEVIWRTSDNKSLRVYCTPNETKYRITTLTHDVQYRTQVAGEQNCYNQPAHASFYLGSDQPLPGRPSVTVNKSNGSGPVIQVTTPVQTQTQTQSTESLNRNYGDINNDNTVDLSDLTLISQYLIHDISFDETQKKYADCNGDGNLGLADLSQLKQFISKENVKLGPQ